MAATENTPLGQIIKGKSVLVTGAGGGMGAGIARRFALAGANVAVCDLKPATATLEIIEKTGVKAYACTRMYLTLRV